MEDARILLLPRAKKPIEKWGKISNRYCIEEVGERSEFAFFISLSTRKKKGGGGTVHTIKNVLLDYHPILTVSEMVSYLRSGNNVSGIKAACGHFWAIVVL